MAATPTATQQHVLAAVQESRDAVIARVLMTSPPSAATNGGGGSSSGLEPAGERFATGRTVPENDGRRSGSNATAAAAATAFGSPKVISTASPRQKGEPASAPSTRVEALQMELDARRAAMTRLETENLALLRDITQWKLAEEQRAQSLVTAHQEEVRALREKLHRLSEEKSRELQRIVKTSSDRRANASSRREHETVVLLEEKLAAKTEEHATAVRRLTTLEEKLRNKASAEEADHEILLGKVQGLQSLLDDKERELFQQMRQCEIARKQLEDKTNENLKVGREVDALRLQVAFLTEECRSKDAKAEAAQGVVNDTKEHLAHLRDELARLQAEVIEKDVAIATGASATKEASRSLQLEVERQRLIVERVERELETQRFERQRVDAQLQSSRDSLRDAQQTILSKEQDLAVARQNEERLRTSISDLTNRLHRADNELFLVAKESASRGAALQSLQQESQAIKESLQTRVKALEEAVENAKSAVMRAVRDYEAEQQVAGELEARLAAANEKSADTAVLRRRVEEMEHELRKSRQAHEELHRQFEDAIRHIAVLERASEEQRDVERKLTAERQALVDECAGFAAELEACKRREAAHEAVKQRCEEGEAALRTKHEELQILTVAYEELRHHTMTMQQEVSQIPQLESSVAAILEDKRLLAQQCEHAQATLLSEREAVSRLTSSQETTWRRLKEVEDELAIKEAELAGMRVLENELQDVRGQAASLEKHLSEEIAKKHRAEIAQQASEDEVHRLQQVLSGERTVTEEVRAQLSRAQALLADAQQRVGRLEVRDGDLTKSNERLRVENQTLSAECATLHANFTALQERADAANDDAAVSRKQIAELEAERNKLTSTVTTLTANLDEARGLLSASAAQQHAAEERVASLESKAATAAALEAKVRAQFQLLQSKTAECDVLQRELEAARDQLSGVDGQHALRKVLEANLDSMRRAHHSANDELAELSQQNEALKKRLAACDLDRTSRERDKARFEDQLATERSRCEALSREVEVLERNLKAKASLEGRFQALEEINEEQRESIAKLRAQVAQLESVGRDDAHQQNATRELHAELKQVRALLDGKEVALRALEDELDRKSALLQQCRREAQQREIDHARVAEDLQEKSRQLERLTRERDDLREEVRERGIHASVSRERSSLEVSRRREEEADLLQQLQRSSAETEAVRAKLHRAEELIADLRAQVQSVEVAKSRIQLEFDLVRTALDDSRRGHADTQDLLVNLRSQTALLSADLSEKERVILFLEQKHASELQQRDEDVNNLAFMIDELKRVVAQRSVASNTDQTERERAMASLTRAEGTITALRAELAAAQNELRSVRLLATRPGSSRSPSQLAGDDEIAATKATMRELERRLEESESQLADERRRCQRTGEQHDQLLQSVEALKKAFVSRESSLTADVKELRRHVQLLTNEKEQLRAALQRLSSQQGS